MVLKRFVAGAMVLALMGASSGAALADKVYGAIATSDSYYGISTNMSSKDDAKSVALAHCRSLAKKKDEECKFQVWFTHCGAVAENDKYVAWGLGDTKKEASATALEKLDDPNGQVSAGCNDF